MTNPTQLEREAACWRLFCKRMSYSLTPVRSSWKIVANDPMYGDEQEVKDWKEQVERYCASEMEKK